mgnify:FL=1
MGPASTPALAERNGESWGEEAGGVTCDSSLGLWRDSRRQAECYTELDNSVLRQRVALQLLDRPYNDPAAGYRISEYRASVLD